MLPPEIWLHIFSFLSYDDLHIIKFTSSMFLELSFIERKTRMRKYIQELNELITDGKTLDREALKFLFRLNFLRRIGYIFISNLTEKIYDKNKYTSKKGLQQKDKEYYDCLRLSDETVDDLINKIISLKIRTTKKNAFGNKLKLIFSTRKFYESMWKLDEGPEIGVNDLLLLDKYFEELSLLLKEILFFCFPNYTSQRLDSLEKEDTKNHKEKVKQDIIRKIRNTQRKLASIEKYKT
jgi:hypothetical protein